MATHNFVFNQVILAENVHAKRMEGNVLKMHSTHYLVIGHMTYGKGTLRQWERKPTAATSWATLSDYPMFINRIPSQTDGATMLWAMYHWFTLTTIKTVSFGSQYNILIKPWDSNEIKSWSTAAMCATRIANPSSVLLNCYYSQYLWIKTHLKPSHFTTFSFLFSQVCDIQTEQHWDTRGMHQSRLILTIITVSVNAGKLSHHDTGARPTL